MSENEWKCPLCGEKMGGDCEYVKCLDIDCEFDVPKIHHAAVMRVRKERDTLKTHLSVVLEEFGAKMEIIQNLCIRRDELVKERDEYKAKLERNQHGGGDMDYICPYCKEGGFDLVGLKTHYFLGHCYEFTKLVI